MAYSLPVFWLRIDRVQNIIVAAGYILSMQSKVTHNRGSTFLPRLKFSLDFKPLFNSTLRFQTSI